MPDSKPTAPRATWPPCSTAQQQQTGKPPNHTANTTKNYQADSPPSCRTRTTTRCHDVDQCSRPNSKQLQRPDSVAPSPLDGLVDGPRLGTTGRQVDIESFCIRAMRTPSAPGVLTRRRPDRSPLSHPDDQSTGHVDDCAPINPGSQASRRLSSTSAWRFDSGTRRHPALPKSWRLDIRTR